MTEMKTNSHSPVTTPSHSPESKQIMLKEIGVKWDKFSETELSALKSKDELVNQVVTKYSLDQAQARRDVDGLLKGRQF